MNTVYNEAKGSPGPGMGMKSRGSNKRKRKRKRTRPCIDANTASSSTCSAAPVSATASAPARPPASPSLPLHSPLTFPPISHVDCNIHPNFSDLAETYPEFKLQWEELKQRQKTKTVVSTITSMSTSESAGIEVGVGDRDKDGNCEDENTSETSGNRNKLSFSSHVNFDFNCALTRAILDKYFHRSLPSMPRGHLCPPVPNRFNYVLWIRRLIGEIEIGSGSGSESSEHENSKSLSGKYFIQSPKLARRGLILGTGSSCIYPLLLTSDEFDINDNSNADMNHLKSKPWKFLGTEIDPFSIQCAQENIDANDDGDGSLRDNIQIVRVVPTRKGGMRTTDLANEDLSKMWGHDHEHVHVDQDGMKSMTEAENNVEINRTTPLFTAMKAARDVFPIHQHEGKCEDGHEHGRNHKHATPRFDFCMTNPPFYSNEKEASRPRQGDVRDRTDMSSNESIYPDGEFGFALDMIYDSLSIRNDVTWYSLMLSKKNSMVQIENELKRIGIAKSSIRTTEFRQGKTTRWGIAWTYLIPSDVSPAAKLVGGLESFQVTLDSASKTEAAVEEVAGRIELFCQELKVVKLKCMRINMDKNHDDACFILISQGDGDDSNELVPRTATIKMPGGIQSVDRFHIQVQIRVPCDCESSVEKCLCYTHTVDVSLSNYSSFDNGLDVIRRIHSLLQGEVCRVNRKWRRIRKRKLSGSTNT